MTFFVFKSFNFLGGFCMIRQIQKAGIQGVGIYMPERIIPNSYWDDKEFLNLPPKKTKEDCFKGIKERRAFPMDMLPSDAEAKAGESALRNANVSPEEIDLVLVHSMVQDEVIPGNASLVQHKLGLKNAAAWNLDTCCSSFVSMLVCASNLIECGTFKKILVVTSVFHSKIIDENYYLSPHAGDGAGAVIIGQVPEEYGLVSSHFTSDGHYHDAFTVRERLPLGAQYRKHYDQIPMRNLMTINYEKALEVGRHSLDHMEEVMFKTLEKVDLTTSDIDFFFSHQPSRWAHKAWRETLGLTEDKSFETFEIYGNLASTSIPASMFHAIKNNKIKKGDTILLASSGAGANHAAALLKWAI